MKNILVLGLMIIVSLTSCAQNNKKKTNFKEEKISMEGMEVATLGAGCFWCVEAIFQRLDGVVKVESGYAGGKVQNPTYKQVCTGETGHAEVCQITYDPKKLSFDDLLHVFFKTHDPTTLNRQGGDEGTQYRSAVFYHNEKQKEIAGHIITVLNDEKAFPNKIVTTIEPFTTFYKAENYHQDYFNQNGYNPYCQMVVKPKVDKFEKIFKDKLKKN